MGGSQFREPPIFFLSSSLHFSQNLEVTKKNRIFVPDMWDILAKAQKRLYNYDWTIM